MRRGLRDDTVAASIIIVETAWRVHRISVPGTTDDSGLTGRTTIPPLVDAPRYTDV